MALHPQIVELMKRAEEAGVKPTHEMTPAAARKQMDAMSRARDQKGRAVGSVEDRVIEGPGGDLVVRLYRPSEDARWEYPALVFFHGGGHVIGSLESHDLVARNLCMDADCVVASVDYRLAPEHKFPAAVDDCFAATRWVFENAASLSIDANRIAVGGDSAGGNLAAVVALMARDAGGPALRYQLLIYPVADYAFSTASYRDYAEGAGILTAPGMAWFRDHYLNGPEDRLDWRAAPLRAEELGDLPPALVITAECDVLHDEGVSYAKALESAGVPVTHRDYPGMMHGFYSFAPLIDDGRAAQQFAAEALRTALYS